MNETFRMEPPHTIWLGDEPIRWAKLHTEDLQLTELPIRRRTAIIPFETGWSITLLWGTGTFSSNHVCPECAHTHVFKEDPELAEMRLSLQDDLVAQPLAYATIHGALFLIEIVKALPPLPKAGKHVIEFMRTVMDDAISRNQAHSD